MEAAATHNAQPGVPEILNGPCLRLLIAKHPSVSAIQIKGGPDRQRSVRCDPPRASVVVLAGTDNAQANQTMPEESLYERLGGVFAIAAVVNHFSDVVKNPIVGQESKNPQLREWHTKNLGRLPGLKFMRTLWVCDVSGGPFQFRATKPSTTPLGLEEAHRDLRISPEEFDEVAAELGRTLDFFKIPKREKDEVLAAFAAHKDEVTAG